MAEKNPLTVEIGKRIQQRRKEMGMSQPALSILCGWGDTASRISNYESGAREPSTADFIKIAKHLKCSPASLQYGERNKIKTEFPLILFDELPKHLKEINTFNKSNWTKWGHFLDKESRKDIFILEILDNTYVSYAIRKGDRLAVSPSEKAEGRMPCVYLHKPTNTITLRHYIRDGASIFLESLIQPTTDRVPAQKMNEYEYIGKVISISRSFV